MTNSASGRFARYAELTTGLSAPLGVLDLDAVNHNAGDMLRRAAGTTIRLESKSLRCLPLIEHLLRTPGVRGALALTLCEARHPPAAAAGQPRARAIRAMKAASRRELAERRAAAVEAVSRVTRLRFVNGGGSGSIDSTRREECITEIAAGSGFIGPALFDRYVDMAPRPAMYFGLDVVRRPAPGIATLLGGGWVASGTRRPASCLSG